MSGQLHSRTAPEYGGQRSQQICRASLEGMIHPLHSEPARSLAPSGAGVPARAREPRHPLPAPAWRVDVEEHELDRWRIPAQVVMLACREAHRMAGVPPWKPLLRRTYLRTRARRAR